MRNGQQGFSLIELLIVVAIILVIASIAIPSLLRSRIAANEAAAVYAVRSITTAQMTYKITYPEVGYASSIGVMGPTNTPSSSLAGLLSSDIALAPNQKNGYTYSSTGTMQTFSVGATPVNPGTSGVRSFCTDTPGVIFFSLPGEACDPASSKALQ